MITLDSLTNLYSGLGTLKDKTTHARHIFRPQDKEQLDAAYRGNWIARKIIDIPANDATRAWRTWSGDPTHVQALEKVEQELNVRGKVNEAIVKSRLYGGAAILLGTGLNLEVPLRVVPKRLKFLHVLERHNISGQEIDSDISHETFGLPIFYQVSALDVSVRIHESHLVRLNPKPLPDFKIRNKDFWGDSVLEALFDAINQTTTVTQSAAHLIQETKVDVIKTPDFMRSMEHEEYRKNIIERFALANQGKSTVNALLMDTEEEWDRITARFAGLPDMLKMFLLIVSGAADIPATRMLGQAPTGLSSTGESDLRNYYDSISAYQNNFLEPALRRLDEALVTHAIGNWPDELSYNWNPLWQMSDEEKTRAELARAQAFQIDVMSGLINDELLREARLAQIKEHGTYPGIETLMDEFKVEPDEVMDVPEDNPNMPPQDKDKPPPDKMN